MGLTPVDNAGNVGIEPNPPGAWLVAVYPVDGNDQISEAVFARRHDTNQKCDRIQYRLSPTDVDMFSFTVVAGQTNLFRY